VLEEKDVIEYFADLAVDSAAKVEVISSKTEDGRMLKSFSGIAALLRYK
jgi:peptide subunit release factor 1 (eRF1)